MSSEDTLVLIKAPVILNLECVPSLQYLLIYVVTAPNYAARRVKLESPIVMITTVKCINVSVAFALVILSQSLQIHLFPHCFDQLGVLHHFQAVIKRI